MKKIFWILPLLIGCADLQVGNNAAGLPIRRHVVYEKGETIATVGGQTWLTAKYDMYWDYIDVNDSGKFERDIDTWRKYE